MYAISNSIPTHIFFIELCGQAMRGSFSVPPPRRDARFRMYACIPPLYFQRYQLLCQKFSPLRSQLVKTRTVEIFQRPPHSARNTEYFSAHKM